MTMPGKLRLLTLFIALLVCVPVAAKAKERANRRQTPIEFVLRLGPSLQSLSLDFFYGRYDSSGPGVHATVQLTGQLTGRGTAGLAAVGSFAPSANVDGERHSHEGPSTVYLIGPVGKLAIYRGLFAEIMVGYAYVKAEIGTSFVTAVDRFGGGGIGVGFTVGKQWREEWGKPGLYFQWAVQKIGMGGEGKDTATGSVIAGGIEFSI